MRGLSGSRMTFVMVLAVLVLGGVGEAPGQEREKVAYKTTPEHVKYPKVHAIEVGDVPGHLMRLVEIRFTYPTDPPVYEGVKATEVWARGFNDYTEVNGPAWGYSISLMENGDKVFSRWSGAAQTVVGADGKKKTTYHGTTILTGGTGKFRGLRGTIRDFVIVDPVAGHHSIQSEGEYWNEK